MPPRTYDVTPFWRAYRYVFAVLGLAIAGFMAYTAETMSGPGRAEARPWLYGLAVFSLALFFAIFFALRGVRLEVSEQGIVYRALGYSVRTGWDNVIGVSDEWPYVGLVLARSGLEPSWWLRAFLTVQGPLAVFSALSGRSTQRLDGDLIGRRIPLEPFVKRWQESELGEWVRRCAPGALERNAGEPAPHEVWRV